MCTCTTHEEADGRVIIDSCPLHDAADDLLAALKEFVRLVETDVILTRHEGREELIALLAQSNTAIDKTEPQREEKCIQHT